MGEVICTLGDAMGLRTFVLSGFFALNGALGHAQTFEEIFSAAEAQVGDMTKFQQALQNPDQRMQYALVQQMLKHPDPALQRIAKEHSLFSTNPVMREAAIKAILDAKSTLRIQVKGSTESTAQIASFVTRAGGTYQSNEGMMLWEVPEAQDEDCWGTRNSCVFRQVGNSLQFNPGGYITSVLTLGNDGVMRGNLTYNNTEFVAVQIDLKE